MMFEFVLAPLRILRFLIFMGIGLLLLGWFGSSLLSRSYHALNSVKTTATLLKQIDKCEIIGEKELIDKSEVVIGSCKEAVLIAKRDYGQDKYRLRPFTDLEISYETVNSSSQQLVISSTDLYATKLPLEPQFPVVYDKNNPTDVRFPLTINTIGLYLLCMFLGLIFISSALYQAIKGQTLLTTIVQSSERKRREKERKKIVDRKEPHF